MCLNPLYVGASSSPKTGDKILINNTVSIPSTSGHRPHRTINQDIAQSFEQSQSPLRRGIVLTHFDVYFAGGSKSLNPLYVGASSSHSKSRERWMVRVQSQSPLRRGIVLTKTYSFGGGEAIASLNPLYVGASSSLHGRILPCPTISVSIPSTSGHRPHCKKGLDHGGE